MGVFVCPVCRAALSAQPGALVCRRGHSFDLARAGYVNLLQKQSSAQKRHGDDRLMVEARTRFLDGGYYDCLLQTLEACAVRIAPQEVYLLDAGCGEGRYTAHVCEALAASGRQCEGYGIDISKEALAAAHRRMPSLQLAVGSVFELPVASHSCQLLLNVFAPHAPAEFARVLARRGVLLRAIPLERHLWELKAAVYDKPYENKVEPFELEGFRLLEALPVRTRITLPDNDTVQDLFKMTPYYYKTSQADQLKLSQLEGLEVGLEFCVLVYRRR